MPMWGGRNVWFGAPAPTTDQYLCMQLEALKQMGSQASVLFLPDRPPRHPTLPITHRHTGTRVRAPSQKQFSHRPTRQIRLHVLCAGSSRLPQSWVTVGEGRGRCGRLPPAGRHFNLLLRHFHLFCRLSPSPSRTGGLSLTAKSFAMHSSSCGQPQPSCIQHFQHYSFGQRERQWQSAAKSWGGEGRKKNLPRSNKCHCKHK